MNKDNVYAIKMYNEFKLYAIVYDETDNRYHFLLMDDDNSEWVVEWRDYSSVDEAIGRIEELKALGIVKEYYRVPGKKQK